MTPDPLMGAREAAHAAYVDAVQRNEHPLDRVNTVVDVVFAVLRAHGVLHAPDPAPTRPQLDDLARDLAHASGLPRYVDGDGWKHLRHSGIDIARAYEKATEGLRPGQEGLAMDLALTRKRLLAGLEVPES